MLVHMAMENMDNAGIAQLLARAKPKRLSYHTRLKRDLELAIAAGREDLVRLIEHKQSLFRAKQAKHAREKRQISNKRKEGL